jgi:peptidoglycan/LPS O-acetylase OafA/YrhL
MGWIGVDLFFVLSGFLISGLLFNEFKSTGAINFRRFIIRRGLKIWPPFYVFLLATALIFVWANYRVPWHALLVSSLFLQNYSHDPLITNGIFVHLWSLAVEEHFYILLPAVLTVLAWSRRRKMAFDLIPGIFAVLALGCLLLRWLFLPAGNLAWATHFRIDSLFAGVLLGYLYHFRSEWFQKMTGHSTLLVALILCCPAALLDAESRFMQTVGLTFLMIGFSFLLAWCVDRSPKSRPGKLMARPLALMGFYSYSIYLWHMYCYALYQSMGNNAVSFWVSLAMAVGLGIIMSKLIEIPALAIREKAIPQRTTGLAQPQP